jgi:hypothetical protein
VGNVYKFKLPDSGKLTVPKSAIRNVEHAIIGILTKKKERFASYFNNMETGDVMTISITSNSEIWFSGEKMDAELDLQFRITK